MNVLFAGVQNGNEVTESQRRKNISIEINQIAALIIARNSKRFVALVSIADRTILFFDIGKIKNNLSFGIEEFGGSIFEWNKGISVFKTQECDLTPGEQIALDIRKRINSVLEGDCFFSFFVEESGKIRSSDKGKAIVVVGYDIGLRFENVVSVGVNETKRIIFFHNGSLFAEIARSGKGAINAHFAGRIDITELFGFGRKSNDIAIIKWKRRIDGGEVGSNPVSILVDDAGLFFDGTAGKIR